MSEELVEVTFSVQGHTRSGEVMCIVGDCPALGEWCPERAKVMKVEGSGDDRYYRSSSLEIWSQEVCVPSDRTVHYRYMIAQVNDSQTDRNSEPKVRVVWWETNRKPRTFSYQECNVSTVKDAEFGFYDGTQSIDKGWLIHHTEIQLRLHSNPICMWKARHRERVYRVKCRAVDLTNRELSVDNDDLESDDLSPCHISVSLYDGAQDKPSEQPRFGTVYNDSDYMVFRLQTVNREALAYQFDLYLHDPNGGPDQEPELVGTSFYLPRNLSDMQGISEMPIIGHQNKPIGHLILDYLVVNPLSSSVSCDMKVSYHRHWKVSRRPLDVAHRGMGSSHGTESTLRQCEWVKENTIHSLAEAGSHGADFVEFDVQLTKDKIPIIYHDLKVSLTLKKKQNEELDWFDIPVSELNLEQLHMLKLDHPSEKSKGRPVSNSSSSENHTEDHQLFPTLRRCLDVLDPHIGFFLEVKYCMNIKTGGREEEMKYFLERNEYVDVILQEVLSHAGERRVILHSFDPDICTMMRVKQNLYPVMFNPLGETSLWTPYDDVRCGDVERAEHYAHRERLLGLNMHTEDLLRPDCRVIAEARRHGMVIFCWGADLNSQEGISRLKDMGVQGVIYDRIAELKQNKENVFKMERDAKLNLLRTMGVIGGTNSLSTDSSRHGNHVGCSQSDVQRTTLDRSHSNSDEGFCSPGNGQEVENMEETGETSGSSVERSLCFTNNG